jgi:DNA-directed RNA polymerase subunit RPC12/RpoP
MEFEKLKQCPSCHERFHTEEIKREPLASDTTQKKDALVTSLHPFFAPEDTYATDKHIQTYKVSYRCKNCGHKWNDLIQQKPKLH